MDNNDLVILRRLMENGRTPWAELAGLTGLTAPGVADRVRRLEQRGVIAGYAARVDGGQLGHPLSALVGVSLSSPRAREALLAFVRNHEAIQTCYHLTGRYDYLLLARLKDIQELERLISEGIKAIPGISATETFVVLDTVKDSPLLPLPGAIAAD